MHVSEYIIPRFTRQNHLFDTWGLETNSPYFTDDISRCTFLNKKSILSKKKKLLWIAPKMNKLANEKMHFNKIFCKMTAIPFRPQYVKLQFVSAHVWQFNAGCRCAVVQYITYNTRKYTSSSVILTSRATNEIRLTQLQDLHEEI